MTGQGEGSGGHAPWRLAYRALLPLMPHGLRARQGDAMLELFDRELRRSATGGAHAVWVVGLTGLADLVRRGVYERISEERRALTTPNVTILRNTALAFLAASIILTAAFVAKIGWDRAGNPMSGTLFDVVLLSIPHTAALTIPMSVFIAVLWAASRRSDSVHGDDPAASAGTLRLAPVIGMACAVALCCLALNSELVPRANLRLRAVYTGAAAVAPDERSMTLHQLRDAESRLLGGSGPAKAVDADGQSVASYEVEIQKKFALATACIVLALLGAAIGGRASRIRLWAQVAISFAVFGGYYVCIIVGEHLADDLTISPAVAMWSANGIALVLAMIARRAATPEARSLALRPE